MDGRVIFLAISRVQHRQKVDIMGVIVEQFSITIRPRTSVDDASPCKSITSTAALFHDHILLVPVLLLLDL